MINNFKKILFIPTLIATQLIASDIKLSQNLTGDFLIAPLYIAHGNICSKIKVMNTNEYSSILAKVTIREKISSREVDLPIFLSPGDVWEGNICNVNNKILLKSTDDSNHPSAKALLEKGIDLLAHSKSTDLDNTRYNNGYVELNGKSFHLSEIHNKSNSYNAGYIEIYPIAQFDEGKRGKINKSLLVQRWERLIDGDDTNTKLRKNGVDENSLSGLISFNSSNQETATIPMTAFENTHSKQILGENINFTSDSNPDILLGKNHKNKILKLLQHKTISFSYDNCGIDQYLYVAFPFGYKQQQSRKYKLVIRDMNENKHTMVFSPSLIFHNELACISIEQLINETNNKGKFTKGMIQIKNIINNNDIQLGKHQSASMLPIITRISQIGGNDMVINGSYTAVK